MNMRHVCSIAAIVELGSGDRCDWDEDTLNRLSERAAAGKLPHFLILVGWAFEVTVERWVEPSHP